MRCSAYCVGNNLNINRIAQYYYSVKKTTCELMGDVLHVPVTDHKDLYYFDNGTLVTWNCRPEETKPIAEWAKRYAEDIDQAMLEDHYLCYATDETDIKHHPYFNVEIITMAEYTQELMLAVSYAVGQSIKLSVYQSLLSDMTEQYGVLIEQLANTGSIHLSRRAITKIIGRIFWVKSLINLRGEFLHLPNYIWQHVNVESVYTMIERYMDMPKRIEMLNQKLDVLNEVFHILSDHLQHQQSVKLEWIIIILLVIEVVFNLITFL